MSRVVTHGEWGRIVAHAWLDPAFAKELSTDPSKAVKSYLGLDPNSEIGVFEIPPRPGDIGDAQLEDVRSGRANLAATPAQPFCCC